MHDKGKDLSHGGAKYNVGPVITGIGIAVVANFLAGIKKIVFEDKITTMEEMINAIDADWIGYDELRLKAQAVPKYGNDDDLVATKRGQANLGAMIQSYFALGAFHVQFNTISTETLLEAQAHPEDYKDLLVRVAGYSTQFVNLSKSMQDSIIKRNAHTDF